MGWLLPLLLLLPQIQPEPAPGLVVTGRLEGGRLPLSALGLGEGGVGEREALYRLGPGQHVTPGGVGVLVRREGVKLEFPSGAEVLFTPTGFLHLRSGEQKGRFPQGVELLLADGSNLRVQLGRGRPIRRVEVQHGDQGILLWDRKGAQRKAVRKRRPFVCPQLLVLGDGDAFYRAVPLGPLVVMERVLCTKKALPVMPARYLVIVADPLIESLRRLPSKFSRKTPDFPDAPGISLALSRQALEIFGREGSSLRRMEASLLRLAMDSGFELTVHVPEVGPLLLSLHSREAPRTLVEWTIGTSTELHMVRPDGGSAENPRYFRTGLPAGEGLNPIASLSSRFSEREWGRATLRAMGAVPLRTSLLPRPGR